MQIPESRPASLNTTSPLSSSPPPTQQKRLLVGVSLLRRRTQSPSQAPSSNPTIVYPSPLKQHSTSTSTSNVTATTIKTKTPSPSIFPSTSPTISASSYGADPRSSSSSSSSSLELMFDTTSNSNAPSPIPLYNHTNFTSDPPSGPLYNKSFHAARKENKISSPRDLHWVRWIGIAIFLLDLVIVLMIKKITDHQQKKNEVEEVEELIDDDMSDISHDDDLESKIEGEMKVSFIADEDGSSTSDDGSSITASYGDFSSITSISTTSYAKSNRCWHGTMPSHGDLESIGGDLKLSFIAEGSDEDDSISVVDNAGDNSDSISSTICGGENDQNWCGIIKFN